MPSIFIFLYLLVSFIPVTQASSITSYLNQFDLQNTSQLIIVEASQGSFKATLTAWQKEQSQWSQIAVMEAVVGRSGIAKFNQKREGDGKTPSGVFVLKRAFGYSSSFNTRLEYLQATKEDVWVDDVNSKHYNQWKNINEIAGAKSFEQMKRDDDLYKAGIVIEYNTEPIVPGLGSAIFLHIWRSPGHPTAGCVALSEENVLTLLQWLDPSLKPMMIIKES
jgi:L,D-peptidoglycan transpeptidase YkuD (ErfK/YbiS/YcfS/YnhG family)